MLATVRTTMLPGVAIDVQPLFGDEYATHQRYVLVLQDGTAGTMELVFPSAQDLRAFLRETRDAFAAAREEVHARKARFRSGSRVIRFTQATLF